MKRTSFIQAVLILLLLGVSWVVLFLRIQREEPTDVIDVPQVNLDVVPQKPSDNLPDPDSGQTPVTTVDPRELVPEDWSEWWDYLDAQESPRAMRSALTALRNLINTMSPEWAADWLLELIESGADMRTGLAFQLQADGRLRAANSLRAYLLDLLQMVDPDLAGSLARQELIEEGTGLVPDVYVIHMRNFARWPGLAEQESIPFLQDKFGTLIRYKPWMENPTSAVAEAMDVAVYTKATQFVPDLTELMEESHPQMLRHASALTMERLVDRMPLETLDFLLENMQTQPEIAKARAGYFARMDPRIPEAGDIFSTYLGSPALSEGEAVHFLDSFPNLNQSLSYNLLSTNISNTPPGEYVDWIIGSIERLQELQNNENLDHLRAVLENTEARLNTQLTGEPLP